jgi:uncharacterized membrane protein
VPKRKLEQQLPPIKKRKEKKKEEEKSLPKNVKAVVGIQKSGLLTRKTMMILLMLTLLLLTLLLLTLPILHHH